MMFENVLVGVDGRPYGRDAIALAERLRGREGKLTLACVHSGEAAEDVAECERLLEQERAAAAGVEAELVGVVAPSPGRGLHEQAERQGADLLVVGSTHRSTIGRAMLGDDTRAALNGAPCAVAIAARGYAERSTPVARLGVAYNETPEAAAALAATKELASAIGATVQALEVVSLPPAAYGGLVAPAIGDYIEEMLQEATGRMAQLPGVEGRAAYGLAGEELGAFSEKVDLLVVGSRGYGPIRRLIAGSTANYLQRHARCSLLVLPRASADTSQPAQAG
jgi:nucleotide-binding universal stress UspA family protein